MKILVILGLLFACAQGADPGELLAQTTAAIRDCVQEKKLDGGKILGIMTKGNLPEDDPEFTGFFTCYYKKLNLLKDNGELDEALIRQLLPALFKQKYGDNVDAQKLAQEAEKHCEGITRDKEPIVTAIRARNCASTYAEEHKGH